MTTPVITQQEALRSVYRMRRILEAAKILNSTLDLAELTAIILRIVQDEVGVDRGTVFVVDRAQGLLRSVVAQGIELNEIVVPLGHGIAGTVAARGDMIDIVDAYADSRFDSSFDAVLGYRTNDLFCMPIVNRSGAVVGVLELLNRTRPLLEEDREFLAGVSVHIGLALENASMHLEIVEKRKIEKEMLLAREIQQNFYPNIPESRSGVQICASCVMCDAVGGDYLDYFKLPEGRFIVTLGDVSGKGIGAALVMSSLHATCRALVRHVQSPEQITNIVNETLIETTTAQTFVTFLVMLIDPQARRIHFVRAGHHPPFMVEPSGKLVWLDQGGGPPVGLFSGTKYGGEVRDIPEGSTLVICTDGVIDAESAEGELFGNERLGALVAGNPGASAAEIHNTIQESVRDFAGNRKPTDDSTLIVLKF